MNGDGLPEKWTLEFDVYQTEMTGPVFTITGFYENSPNSGYGWTCQIGGYGGESLYYSGPDGVSSASPMPGGLNGRRHVSVMASGTSLKVYVDRERLVNIPSMKFQGDQRVTALGFRFWRHQGGDPLMTNVRFAEGGKQKVDMMATPFVTHGIVFDSGSDRLKPESASVLRQVSAYLKENPEVKVLITGHTDDVGDTAANQTLSEKRAAAVAQSLASDFGIDASRMSTAGKGESAPMAPNDSPEGRATNRRVEFSKS
jgi:outer membrane protein OmpA-like peptidoglycan-associated protein